MPVFRTYLKIIKKNAIFILLYAGIFLGFMSILANIGLESEAAYTQTTASFTIIDRDKGGIGDYLRSELSNENEYVVCEDNLRDIRNCLFYREAQMVVIVPEGFTEDFLAGKEVSLETMQVENTVASTMLEQEINGYLKTIKVYLAEGDSFKEAREKAAENRTISIDTELLQEGKRVATLTKYFFQCLPYCIISVILCGMTPTVGVFQKRELRKRNGSSSFPLAKQNLELLIGSFVFCIAMILVIDGIGYFIIGKETNPVIIGYSFINTLLQMLTVMAASFCISFFTNSANAVNAIANVLSLASCFLGGIFVPLDMMNEKLLKLSQFIPAYWYTKANELIMDNEVISESIRTQIFQNFGIQAGFAVLILGIALVVSKKRYMTQ